MFGDSSDNLRLRERKDRTCRLEAAVGVLEGVIDPLEKAMKAQDIEICRLKRIIKEQANVIALLRTRNIEKVVEEVRQGQDVHEDPLLQYSESDVSSPCRPLVQPGLDGQRVGILKSHRKNEGCERPTGDRV